MTVAAALAFAPFAAARGEPPPKPPHDPSRPLGPDVAVGTDDLGEEIVIIARKLRMVNVHLMRISRGKPARCTVTKTSGDTEVDALTCEAAVACSVKFPDRETPADILTACTKDEQARLVEELAEKRIQEELKN